ncbi:MAG: ATP-binding cassette domain-containing protein [bacterium]|nr:ATP-binding cassette domain-containing protein [bacterium]
MNQPMIRVRDLRKSFPARRVLDGVSFDVARGEAFVIIGGSGSGKSVTLKCILGLMKPDAGEIMIDGMATRPADAGLMARFGMLFQGGALFDSLAVWENVAFRQIHTGAMTRAHARDSACETLGLVGLGEDVADLLPAELSGGMMKRVALARAISARPDIVFLDEPTTGLDPIMADVINDLIVSVSRRLGITTISITHDMASARKVADRIAMLHDGRLVWQGNAADIDRSGSAHVDQFINGRAEGPISMSVLRP